MGFLDRFRSSPASRIHFVDEWGLEHVEAVGESFYQPALLKICGGRKGGEAVAYDCTATLVREPNNPHDPNAIKVMIDGRQVGHLSRALAVDYGDAARAAEERGLIISCEARIAGRELAGADTEDVGVFLKLPTPSVVIDRIHKADVA